MKKILIEVGAFDGQDSFQFYMNGYTVYTFEPKTDLYLSLKERTKNLDNYHVYNYAIFNENCTKKFNICNSGGASSILEFKSNQELEKHWTSARTDIQYSGISYDVECIRLDKFIEDNNLQDSIIDYLHIDAQGVDYEVLLSLGKYIQNVREGVVETVINNDKSIYIGQMNNLDNINKLLHENNFRISHMIGNDVTNCEYNVYFVNNKY